MQIYIHRNGQKFGPYSVEDANGYISSGNLHATDLAWYDGAADWLPLGQVPGVIAGATPPPAPVAAVTHPPVPPAGAALHPAPPVPARNPAGQVNLVDAATLKAYKRKMGSRNMLYGALWCGGGLLVTGITYSMASSGSGGGTYLISWGPVIFGAIQFFKGLFMYLSA